jgi:hypothetical protein
MTEFHLSLQATPIVQTLKLHGHKYSELATDDFSQVLSTDIVVRWLIYTCMHAHIANSWKVMKQPLSESKILLAGISSAFDSVSDFVAKRGEKGLNCKIAKPYMPNIGPS